MSAEYLERAADGDPELISVAIQPTLRSIPSRLVTESRCWTNTRRRLLGSWSVLMLPFLLLVCLWPGRNLLAETPRLSQMVHVSWTARDGAPHAIKALAQAPDGTLWIGSYGGLFNFDGINFRQFESFAGEPTLPSDAIISLCVATDGALWAAMATGGVARIAGGHVIIYTAADGKPLGPVQHLQPANGNEVWGLSGQKQLVHFGHDGRWHKEEMPVKEPSRVTSFFLDRAGVLWVPQSGYLYKRRPGQVGYTRTSIKVDWMFAAAEEPDGSIWLTDVITASDKGRTQHLDKHGNLLAHLLLKEEMFDMAFAADGTLWLATQLEGLRRLHPEELVSHPIRAVRGNDDRYTRVDGLSSDQTAALLIDRDGNVWSAGSHGVDRFTPAVLRPFSSDAHESEWSVCSNGAGEVWIGSSRGRLYKVSGGMTRQFSGVGDIYAVACSSAPGVRFADHGGIGMISGNRIERLPPIPGALHYSIMHVAVARNDTVVTTAGTLKGIWAFKDGRWNALNCRPPLDYRAIAVFADSHDRLWTAYRDGELDVSSSGCGQVLSSGNPGIGLIYSFLESPQGVFAAGMNGVVLIRDGKSQKLAFVDQLATRGTTGVVQSLTGDLWLNGARGIVRVPRKELETWLAHSEYRMRSELFREGDFTGPAPLFNYTPSAVRDDTGRLWFAMLDGVVSIDPAHLYLASHPPLLSIREALADGNLLAANEKLSPKTQTVTVRYFGVNLTTPERVTYRYKLSGLDTLWQDVGHRTEAIYTRLRPGSYTFQVIASNGDGSWSPPTSTAFAILPSFYQTWWFLALCALGLLVLFLSTLHLRVRYVASIIRTRAEERAEERVRIARDLHDTLLQGVQGLLLSFHVAAQKVPIQDDSRAMLEKALASADRIILEGRNRVNRLRSEHITDGELVEHIQRVGADLSLGNNVAFRVQRIGISAALQPHVAEEIYCVMREALTNAFRHSEASSIEILLDYQRRRFNSYCKDNGCGFEQERRREAPRTGHWGLRGMLERAEKLGGTFQCQTSSQGTIVSVSLPTNRVYEKRHWLHSARVSLLSHPFAVLLKRDN